MTSATALTLPQPKRVGLIRPATPSSRRSAPAAAPPVPFELAYLAGALTDAGHAVTVVDAAIEEAGRATRHHGIWYRGRPVDETLACLDADTALVAITYAHPREWPWIAALFQAIRERLPGTTIATIRARAATAPESAPGARPDLDLWVTGDGDHLIDIARCGGERQRPVWHLFPVDLYFQAARRGAPRRSLPVLASRPSAQSGGSIARPPRDIVHEMESAVEGYEVNHVQLVGSPGGLDRAWLLDLCQEIERLGIRVQWDLPEGLSPHTIDDDVATALVTAGCRRLTLAARSAPVAGTDPAGQADDTCALKRATRAAYRHGLATSTTAAIGRAGDTRMDLVRAAILTGRQAYWRVAEAKLTLPASRPCVPAWELALWRLMARASFLSLAWLLRLLTAARPVPSMAGRPTAGRLARRIREWLPATSRERVPAAGSR